MLIDCPPNLHLCSWTALAASDHLVVPLQPEDYGAQGIADVLESLARVRAAGFPVGLLGYLITMVSPRRTLHQLYEEQLRELYGRQVFAARVPESPEFPEAISRRQTIAQYKPKGAAAKAIRALAEELLERIDGSPVAEPGGGGMSKRDELMKGLRNVRESMGDFDGWCAAHQQPDPGRCPPTWSASSAARTSPRSPLTVSTATRRSHARNSIPKGWNASPSRSGSAACSSPSACAGTRAQERYVIICGERRWRAAKIAGLESLACVIVEGDLTTQERLADPVGRERPPRGFEAHRAGHGPTRP